MDNSVIWGGLRGWGAGGGDPLGPWPPGGPLLHPPTPQAAGVGSQAKWVPTPAPPIPHGHSTLPFLIFLCFLTPLTVLGFLNHSKLASFRQHLTRVCVLTPFELAHFT